MSALSDNELGPSENKVPKFYANSFTIKLSVYDFLLSFGEVEDVVDGELFIKKKVDIVMSPQHAKAMAGVLIKNVEMYEETFGPLSIAELAKED